MNVFIEMMEEANLKVLYQIILIILDIYLIRKVYSNCIEMFQHQQFLYHFVFKHKQH